MRPTKRFEQIELVIPAASAATRFNFPDIPQLRSDVTKDIWIRAIDTYSADSKPFDFNGNPVAPYASLQLADLTLYVQGSESIFRFPLVRLLNTFMIAANPVTWTDELNEFDNLEVDWTKSYISTPVAFGNAAQMAFIFGISYYQLLPGTMNEIKKRTGIPQNLDIAPGMPMYLQPGSFQ